MDDPSGHARIRSLIRDKYGFRDRWVGLVFDTSRSVAVQLISDPTAHPGPSPVPRAERQVGFGGQP